MAQITTGIRSILSHPFFYNLTQNTLGVRKARRVLAGEFIPQGKGLRLLDIGCGTAEILEFLPEDMAYTGFDASAAYIAQAKRRFGHRGVFFADLVCSMHLDAMQDFDVVLAFGVLHHLDDNEANQLIALAADGLKPSGVLLTVDPCFVPGQSSIAHWLIAHDRGQNVRDEEGYRMLGEKCFGSVQTVARHDFLRLPYTYLVMQCRSARGKHD